MSPRFHLLACAVALLSAAPPRAAAQSQEAGPAAVAEPVPPPPSAANEAAICPWGTSRVINGHRFIFPAFVENSFVSTYLDTRTGAQLRRVRDLPLGRLGTRDLEQIEVAEALEGGLQLFDRLGLFGTFAGRATVGTNVSALIFLPVQYDFSADGGVVFRVLRLEELGTQVSLRARVGTAGGRRLSIAPFLNALVGSTVETAEALAEGNAAQLLVNRFSAFRWGGSVAAAQPLSEVFSLQASAGVLFENSTFKPFDVAAGTRVDRDFSVFQPSAGLAATADARPLGVPLALMGEYLITSRRTTNEQTDTDRTRTQHVLAAGLYYSGRTDLQAGLLAFAQLGLDPVEGRDVNRNPAESDTPQVFGGQLVLRYVW